MGLVRLTVEDIEKLAELFVRAISINVPIHRDKEGNGPKHCPVVIWEDALAVDIDSVKQHNPNVHIQHKTTR